MVFDGAAIKQMLKSAIFKNFREYVPEIFIHYVKISIFTSGLGMQHLYWALTHLDLVQEQNMGKWVDVWSQKQPEIDKTFSGWLPTRPSCC
jgi:hypothetical protein